MATSDKGQQVDWVRPPAGAGEQHETGTPTATIIEPPYVQPEPFSENDTFRAERIVEISEQNADISAYLQEDEFENINAATAETLSRDASERQKWPEAVALQYGGLLQLAAIRTPGRKNRIL